ncbi:MULTISPECIES: hypothetical protein [unclassified Streptomyces]|uniref:hypothetical protein n=1 Tax=unclassified Streptomyces TaxID=2593676 RepID=UPI0004CC4BEC|nr:MULTISPECIES: hypothetical protein [unclassified Streptomyces]
MSDEQTEGVSQGSARIDGRAQSLRPSVPLYRHMLYGSGLPQPLDFLVLAHIHYMCEDGKSFCVDDLVEALRNEGVLSANGKGLIGSKAVYQSVARLREVGFLHRTQANGGNFGRVSYTFYEFPSLNPHWTLAGIAESATEPVGLSGEAVPSGNRIGTGQTASPDRARADKARADRPRGNRAEIAGRTASPEKARGQGSPPHPPEGGGGTPPPNPRNKGRAPKADRYAEQCALTADDYQPTAEEIRAADAFLQDLPGKWQMGPDEARALAPLLASRAHTQGYEFDTYLELVLVQDDADKPATRPSRVMPYRVRNLKRRRTEDKPLPGAQAAPGGLAEWCGVCNVGERPAAVYQRTRELPDGRDVPCPECHPKFTRA